jgi:hypothetical protein
MGNVIVNMGLLLLGLAIILVPLGAAYYSDINQQLSDILYFATVMGYTVFILNSIAYFGGCIKCHNSIAKAVVAEIKASKNYVSYIFPLLIVAVALYIAIQHGMFILPILMILPLLINKISSTILYLKSRKT